MLQEVRFPKTHLSRQRISRTRRRFPVQPNLGAQRSTQRLAARCFSWLRGRAGALTAALNF